MMLHRLPALANTRLVLASASPRRVELLKQAGLPAFDVRPSSFEEDLDPAACGGAAGYAVATAAAKVDDVVACILAEDGGDPRQTLVLAADTVVESAAGAVLEKPADAAHAAAMLASLSGTTHAVHTGVALRVVEGPGGVTARRQFAVTTRVTFASLTPADIDAYIATGEPYGKAGAYGIQGAAGAFVERVEGCYANVVGLPLNAVTSALADMVDGGEVGQWKTV